MARESHAKSNCPRCETVSAAGAKFCARCGCSLGGEAYRSLTRPSPLLDRWRRLSYTLTRREIKRLLGEPHRVCPPSDPATDEVERWVYEYEATDDSRRRVVGELRISIAESRLISWSEPEWEAVSADALGSPPRL